MLETCLLWVVWKVLHIKYTRGGECAALSMPLPLHSLWEAARPPQGDINFFSLKFHFLIEDKEKTRIVFKAFRNITRKKRNAMLMFSMDKIHFFKARIFSVIWLFHQLTDKTSLCLYISHLERLAEEADENNKWAFYFKWRFLNEVICIFLIREMFSFRVWLTHDKEDVRCGHCCKPVNLRVSLLKPLPSPDL